MYKCLSTTVTSSTRHCPDGSLCFGLDTSRARTALGRSKEKVADYLYCRPRHTGRCRGLLGTAAELSSVGRYLLVPAWNFDLVRSLSWYGISVPGPHAGRLINGGRSTCGTVRLLPSRPRPTFTHQSSSQPQDAETCALRHCHMSPSL